jgi:hypothetical protein
MGDSLMRMMKDQLGVLVAAGVGIMFSVRSGKPTISEEIER